MSEELNSVEDIERFRIVHEIQKEVVEWAKWRLSIIVVIGAFVGFFGIGSFIESTVSERLNDTIREATKLIGKTEGTIETAKKQVESSVAESKKATARAIAEADAIEESILGLKTAAADIRVELDRQSNESAAATSATKTIAFENIKGLQNQIANLEEIVSQLSANAPRENLVKLENQQKEARAESEKLSEILQNNSEYFTNIQVLPDSNEQLTEKISKQLQKAGFAVKKYNVDKESIPNIWGVPSEEIGTSVVVMYHEGEQQIAHIVRSTLIDVIGTLQISLVEKTGGGNQYLGVYVPSASKKLLN